MKIIIKTKQPKQQGLFACVFAQLLEILPFLKKNNIYPEFIITSVFYGLGRTRNVFPHYVQHNYDYETNNNMEPNMELVNSLKNESSTENCIEIYFEEVYKKKSEYITIIPLLDNCPSHLKKEVNLIFLFIMNFNKN